MKIKWIGCFCQIGQHSFTLHSGVRFQLLARPLKIVLILYLSQFCANIRHYMVRTLVLLFLRFGFSFSYCRCRGQFPVLFSFCSFVFLFFWDDERWRLSNDWNFENDKCITHWQQRRDGEHGTHSNFLLFGKCIGSGVLFRIGFGFSFLKSIHHRYEVNVCQVGAWCAIRKYEKRHTIHRYLIQCYFSSSY